MLYLVLCTIALIVTVFLFSYFSKTKNSIKEKDEIIEIPADCCGAHEVCDIDIKRLSEEVIYFDDEELDKYREKGELEYEDNEIDEFRDILYTLKQEEIAEWLHSLELRRVFVPIELKSEVISLMTE